MAAVAASSSSSPAATGTKLEADVADVADPDADGEQQQQENADFPDEEQPASFGALDRRRSSGEARFESMMDQDEDALNPWEEATIMANVCEYAGQLDDMKVYMKERCAAGPMLAPEERDLLSVAFKGNLDALRKAHRTASLIAADLAKGPDKREAELAAAYQAQLKQETEELCLDLLDLVAKLIERAETGEGIVFYHKMQADYRRYLAEVSDVDQLQEALKAAEEGYLEAIKEADMHLLHTHPVRLGLLLNWSVFLHEGLLRTAEAVAVAKTAAANAMQSLEGMPEEAFRDALPTIRLLSENAAAWQHEEGE